MGNNVQKEKKIKEKRKEINENLEILKAQRIEEKYYQKNNDQTRFLKTKKIKNKIKIKSR